MSSTPTREEMRNMLGQNSTQTQAFYKVNEVRMSGDDGHFYLRETLKERKPGEKINQIDLGKELRGVVLRMRWKLSKYIEDASGGTFISSTEYDDKNKDTVMIFPQKERGNVPQMKEKYGLGTQRVIYFYLPERHEIVRFIVKSSAMKNDNNPKDENGNPIGMGLFDYQNQLGNDELLMNEVITVAKGIYREDPKGNKRKNYWATNFESAGVVEDAAKIQQLTMDVYEKTKSTFAPSETPDEQPEEMSDQDDIASSIPFN